MRSGCFVEAGDQRIDGFELVRFVDEKIRPALGGDDAVLARGALERAHDGGTDGDDAAAFAASRVYARRGFGGDDEAFAPRTLGVVETLAAAVLGERPLFKFLV